MSDTFLWAPEPGPSCPQCGLARRGCDCVEPPDVRPPAGGDDDAAAVLHALVAELTEDETREVVGMLRTWRAGL